MVLSVSAFSASDKEAVALVEKGVAYINSNGYDAALKAFSDPSGGFNQGELYLFVIGHDGVTKAHGAKAALIGRDLSNLKSISGKYFIKDMIAMSKAGKKGWVEYQWQNPATSKLGNKVSYVFPLEGKNAFIGCGYYK